MSASLRRSRMRSDRSYIFLARSSLRRSMRMDMTESRVPSSSSSSGMMPSMESNSSMRAILASASSLDMEESAMALLDSFAISNITAMASRVLKSSSIASQNLLRYSSISFPAAFPEGVLETYERSSR